MLNPQARRAFVLGIIGCGLVFVVISTLVRTNSTVWASPQAQASIRLPFIMRNYPLPPAPPAAPPIFGISMPQTMTGLDPMAAAGVKWVRTDLYWDNVEPSKGVRNWNMGTNAGLEQGLQAAAQRNVNVILIVHTSPGWAQKVSGSGCGPIKSSEFGAFASFVHDAVARYSVAPYNLKYWEIWNEPDVAVQAGDWFGCWGDPMDPYFGGGYYADMLKVVYPQVKAADAQAQVVVGGLLLDCDPRNPPDGKDCKPSQFLEGILRNGGSAFFDGVSYHAYDYYFGQIGQYTNGNWAGGWNTTGPVGITKTNFVKEVLSRYKAGDKYLMITETAVLCYLCSRRTPAWDATKEYYIAQSYASALAQGLRANVWYNWADFLAQIEGPAYTAYAFAQSTLLNATYSADIGSGSLGGVTGLKGYKFIRDNRWVWVLWSLDGNPHTVNFAEGAPSGVWDVLGNTLAPSSSMQITIMPVYLEWYR